MRSVRKRSPIPKGNWKPIGARKFGYDVSVRPYVRTDCGRGSGIGWGWSDWQFLRREIKLGNLRFSWREF